ATQLISLHGDRIEARRWVWLGLLVGTSAITKLSGLTLLPVVLGAVFAAVPRSQWRAAIRPAAGFLGTVGLVAGWWYLRNLWLYGDPTGLNAMMEWLGRRIGPYSWSEVFPDLAHLWTSSWALFGWSNVPADDWVYYLFGLLAALSLLGWLVLLARRRSVPRHARFGLAIIVSYLVLLALSLVRYHMMTVAGVRKASP
ncbi:MAG: hypothetical protein M1358_15920, partial [Chloroflexi bacterium]|nr:hypothetical protein [Chloroflexota bacterium]